MSDTAHNETKAWILDAVSNGIQDHAFAFGLDFAGRRYDVYHFHIDRKPGTLAFTRREDKRFEIAVFHLGKHLTEGHVLVKLAEGLSDTRNGT